MVATFALLWYGARLHPRWQMLFQATGRFEPQRWWTALILFALAGTVAAVAARFPFPLPRFAWGRLVLAGVLLIPALQITLWVDGWTHPAWLFQPRWVDAVTIAELGATLAGVAIGCGFGARRAAPSA